MKTIDPERRLLARAVWQYGEPVHAIIYYAPERREATDALGLKGGWMSYFGCRAAPLGAVTAPVVSALFYNFHPQMVARAIPDAWTYAAPATLLDARLRAMDKAMRRVLGEEVVSSSPVRRAAELAAAAVAGCDMAGRPMGAANQAVPEPDEPHLRLWQALTAVREHRGDGHVARLVDAGVSPSEALVLQAATGRSPEDGLRSNRGWSSDEWSSAIGSLISRGLVSDNLRISQAGDQLRQAIEDGTDRLAAPIVAALGDDRAAELVALLGPLANAVMAAGAVPAHNNMGVPWPPPRP
jgi:helix-turn-helix protein